MISTCSPSSISASGCDSCGVEGFPEVERLCDILGFTLPMHPVGAQAESLGGQFRETRRLMTRLILVGGDVERLDLGPAFADEGRKFMDLASAVGGRDSRHATL